MTNAGAAWGFGPDVTGGVIGLPAWTAGALLALFLVVSVIALNRDGSSRGTRVLVAGILVGVVGLSALALLGRPDQRAVAARVLDLNARVLPASPLACLVSAAGEEVESACEARLFANPETVAAALTLVEAQVALLAEFSGESAEISQPLSGLRRVIEADRYGLVARVLATRYGCGGQQCAAYALLRDTGRIKANVRAHTYDVLVKRHAGAWATTTAPAAVATPSALPGVAAAGQADTATGAAAMGSASPSTSTAPFDYPTAASIPPVSIMNAEPGATGPSAAASASAPPPKTEANAADASSAAGAVPAPAKRPQAASRRIQSSGAAGAAADGAALPPPLDLQANERPQTGPTTR